MFNIHNKYSKWSNNHKNCLNKNKVYNKYLIIIVVMKKLYFIFLRYWGSMTLFSKKLYTYLFVFQTYITVMHKVML
jgi:hypothetical protein